MYEGELGISQAKEEYAARYGTPRGDCGLLGSRFVLEQGAKGFPEALEHIANPPERLYGVGDPDALVEGLAVIGARKATPYGLMCARSFAGMAAERGITIISGGALGCDSAAHRAALDAGGRTVVFLGGGCDNVYPRRNRRLFQEVVDSGGAVVSEREWSFPPLPYTFRARNRLIAGLARATLIVEAGVPSGTFSTADDALSANREVLAVPGSIASAGSRGANHLICQGATPIVDRETFEDALFSLFGCLRTEGSGGSRPMKDPILAALCADPMAAEELIAAGLGGKSGADPAASVAIRLAQLQREGLVVRHADGRYGPGSLFL
ncbi:MAG: DNA-processing protein DprA [Coriobacteriia bacterium]|nr:DNA-processing protein DprA [Coriobacteriia bacterium]